MAASAEAMLLDTAAAAQTAVSAPRPSLPLVFAPETFFLGRTEGAGVVRDPFGRITRRCHVATEGSYSAAQGALRFDETFTYDDGEVDVWRWVMQAGREGRYVAAEAKAGAGIAGETRGGDYVIAFRRPVGRAAGVLKPHFLTRFTLLAPDTVLKQARVSLFGLPLGVLTALHRASRSSRPVKVDIVFITFFSATLTFVARRSPSVAARGARSWACSASSSGSTAASTGWATCGAASSRPWRFPCLA